MKGTSNYVPIQPFFELTTHEYESKFSCASGILAQYYNFNTSSNIDNGVIAVPDGTIDIMFHSSDNKPTARIYGSVKRGTYIPFEKEQNYFGVRFFPGAAEKLLKCPLDMFTESYIDVDQILGKSEELIDKLCFTDTFKNKVNLFESYYASNREHNKISPLMNYVIKKINKTYGEVKVKALAEETGYSSRHINNQFKKHIGIAPKLYMRIVRFQRSFKLIRSHSNIDFAEIAEDVGYYDQAHFINEFKEFSLNTPSQILNY